MEQSAADVGRRSASFDYSYSPLLLDASRIWDRAQPANERGQMFHLARAQSGTEALDRMSVFGCGGRKGSGSVSHTWQLQDCSEFLDNPLTM